MQGPVLTCRACCRLGLHQDMRYSVSALFEALCNDEEVLQVEYEY